MKVTERVQIIIEEMQKLYPNPQIPLTHTNNFTFLIAVVLSAQSTDKKVNELTPPLFKQASDPYQMYQLGERRIYNHIRELGLSRRKAKYISQLSEIIYTKYQSEIPSNFIDLESLPGVGHKTASVIMSQAFGVPTFPVDTHIHRVSQRWELTDGRNVIQTEKDLKRLFPRNKWNKLHLQMIFYGREYCTSRGCDGTKCKLCKTLFPYRAKSIICHKP